MGKNGGDADSCILEIDVTSTCAYARGSSRIVRARLSVTVRQNRTLTELSESEVPITPLTAMASRSNPSDMEGHGEKEKFHKKKTSIYLTPFLVSAAWSTSCREIEGNLAATVSLSLFPTRRTRTHGQCEESNMAKGKVKERASFRTNRERTQKYRMLRSSGEDALGAGRLAKQSCVARVRKHIVD